MTVLILPLQTFMVEGNPILFVIDTLDECKERDAVLVLAILARKVHQLRRLKVFITARHIRNVPAEYQNYEQFCLQDASEDGPPRYRSR